MASLKPEHQALYAQFQQLQKNMQNFVHTKQKLEAQQHENSMVKEEFDQCVADSVVYKLIGPILVKQDVGEAKENVDKRLSFIKTELAKVDKSCEETGKEIEQVRNQLMIIQQDNAKRAKDEAHRALKK